MEEKLFLLSLFHLLNFNLAFREDLYKSCSVGDSKGRCVFSLSCLHSGGTHLGVCRENFLFGSCCKLKFNQQNLIEENEVEAILNEEDSSLLPTATCGMRFNDFTTPEEDLTSRRLFNSRPQSRLIGGEPALFGAWPWQISLRIIASDESSNHRCGAVLISESWAITAAHCVHYYEMEEILLRMGDYNRVEEDEPLPHMDRRPSKIIEHPKYNPRNFENDIALMHFKKPVPFLPHIRSICLPEQGEDVVGKTGYVTGWGEIYEEGPRPRILHEVDIPIFGHKRCTDLFTKADLDELVTDVFICAGEEEGGKDACEGDSGGPLVFKSKKRGQWVLAGITSWGRGCGEKYQPGVYTRVPIYVEWVLETIKNFGKIR
ncbi:mite allergen Der p 3 isoform X2 [Lepeophtheirus salmonis]|uniref:mite allergen Der p 3 isoform X2 n=1 Tax=Lepeophtheirus salmonis TaxID=72036 RepID=UPI001AE6B1B5|nr:serine proteinase stubble-like isoform X2 [Lepeophtheirus salmonis]